MPDGQAILCLSREIFVQCFPPFDAPLPFGPAPKLFPIPLSPPGTRLALSPIGWHFAAANLNQGVSSMRTQLFPVATQATSKSRIRSFDDESLVADPRDSVRPAQFVEQKLISLLKTNAVPVSFTLLRNRVSGRTR
jgi:hypothetical protein